MARFLTLMLLGLSLSVAACNPRSPTPEATPAPGGAVEAGNGGPTSPDRTPDTDWLVIPGQRVGPVTVSTSRADLANRYGESALTDAPIAMGEGFTEAGTVVVPGPDQQFSVVWDDATQTSPLLVRDFGPRWQTPEGLGIGVPFSTLKAVLGDFDLYGFEWDYGGTLVLEGSQLDQYDGYLLLRVTPSAPAAAQHPEAYQALSGDRLFASSNPNLDPLNLSVYDMVVYFDAP